MSGKCSKFIFRKKIAKKMQKKKSGKKKVPTEKILLEMKMSGKWGQEIKKTG